MEKMVDINAKEEYDSSLQRGICRSQKVESGFRRAWGPESQFLNSIWGIPAKLPLLD